ncbi:NADH-quinone oxidoreductase subunit L [Candidatus Nitrospira allomarina]|jgi:NADH-quinone oxidoreductase subunit L|uniref:NADH-ubiquinone oxidoreductase chain 5 n=1 Tax=Candidatus Nitrospira allomarina TaxID=3020900 RepID=A0AA96GEZ6_9BACT|nr:NADH-quinone oxidoreductase subunit L [Candidatus Nitrospira allomarina]WNM59837.1 NADH-quinone oxidoreductase subunit L [Candidatus Nitrospira allomarina]
MLYALIPLLPLLAFVILGLFGHWIKNRSHWVAVPAVLGSFLLSIMALVDVAGGQTLQIPLYTWADSGNLHIALGLFIDQLTVAMLLLVTIVSSLVHVYTIGYMHGEPGYARFFSNIALFTFSMLMLVMSDNFLQLFVFWEAVGLCSYLLIGHWYERESARAAATKAFLVNRVGDFGFMLGILLIFVTFGSLHYQEVFSQLDQKSGGLVNLLGSVGGHWEISVMTLICLFLFVGAVGKSAQVPLHVWLPDAMEGPTPISALIHAATMVTAGVFMVARFAPLFNLSPVAMDVVAVVGGATMFIGATIALTQTDIKRVVAYSTLSQLGYMMMACGLGGYIAGMYHLLTHGAFKALLFLGCGSVIIALHHEQDMKHMGGLRDKLPVTYWTFLIGALALSGFPLTAGYFSKDELLLAAWMASGLGKVLAVLGLLTALMTAFYSFRLVFVTFWGESRVDPHHAKHVHEPSKSMTFPLLILAVLSILAGYMGIPEFLAPAFPAAGNGGDHHEGSAAIGMMVTATAMGLLGIAGAYWVYVKSPGLPDRLANQWRSLYQFSLNKWFVDEAYDRTVVMPTLNLADRLWKRVDIAVIDGAVNGVARAVAWGGWVTRRLQSGQAQNYALAMTVGAAVILGAMIFY